MYRKLRIRQVKTPPSKASGQHVCACASGLQCRWKLKVILTHSRHRKDTIMNKHV